MPGVLRRMLYFVHHDKNKALNLLANLWLRTLDAYLSSLSTSLSIRPDTPSSARAPRTRRCPGTSASSPRRPSRRPSPRRSASTALTAPSCVRGREPHGGGKREEARGALPPRWRGARPGRVSRRYRVGAPAFASASRNAPGSLSETARRLQGSGSSIHSHRRRLKRTSTTFL